VTYDLQSVGDIIVVQPRRNKLKTNEYHECGRLPIVDQGAGFIAGYTDQVDRAYEGELPVTIFGDHTCCLKFVDFPFAIGADGTQVLRPIDGIEPRFLYYALHTAELEQFGYQRHFKLLKECKVPVPPIETQRRMAGILGAYDDLIEVNRRRVAVLEDMARGLFEEWFVRLRFPGHESVPLHNTPDGPLPEGWHWGAFGDLVTELRVAVQPADIEPDAVYLGLEHLPRRSTTLADKGAAGDVSSMKLRFQRGDILFGKIRPYFHKVVWAPCDGVCSSDAIVWRPVARHQAQALAIASSDVFVNHSVQTSNGTKMPRANPKVLSQFKCAMAPAVLSDQFERLCLPMVEAAAGYQAANQRLAASRDLLLPRLMSGGLSVAEAQKELEIA
jgi:type I restriction enzyme S subunit